MECGDWIMFALLALLVGRAAQSEARDVNCPGPGETRETCARGADIAFQASVPDASDTADALLDKIVNASRGVERAIVWRKALLAAVAVSALIFAVVVKRMPTWQEFYVASLLGFVVNVQIVNFYKHHVYRKGIQNIEQATMMLRTQP
uniref:3 transmembrane helices protein n=1 Tax=Marseillevirus LCMAC103 TaxID=2506604 RepID=A0A481YWE7_9VIRU|nr:MAG: 3 transmembrane helices protein [Marseillevirus LCMAC103]